MLGWIAQLIIVPSRVPIWLGAFAPDPAGGIRLWLKTLESCLMNIGLWSRSMTLYHSHKLVNSDSRIHFISNLLRRTTTTLPTSFPRPTASSIQQLVNDVVIFNSFAKEQESQDWADHGQLSGRNQRLHCSCGTLGDSGAIKCIHSVGWARSKVFYCKTTLLTAPQTNRQCFTLSLHLSCCSTLLIWDTILFASLQKSLFH